MLWDYYVPVRQSHAHQATYPELANKFHAGIGAWNVASREVDRGMWRKRGATPREWKSEFDARITLREARARYITAVNAFVAGAEAELQVLRASLGASRRDMAERSAFVRTALSQLRKPAA